MSDQVRLMFSDIAPGYDLGNDVLSFGTHRLWKRRMVRASRVSAGDRVLDLATGTGDIALLFSDAVKSDGRVTGVDFCADMIDQAQRRPKNQRDNISFEVGDAMNLRFADGVFDVTSISFGIRNVDDPVKALGEMRRVTRIGGRVVVLEFGQPRGLFGALYRFYTGRIGPLVGGLITGHRNAYSYLEQTAARFPSGSAFVELMARAGMNRVESQPLFGGIAWLYTAEV
ncbi:MAG: bifunctional demethylmenaquinone methyltransferase/2-methoxy-6-polyprenyl-1,4-benzoquinol methylase UbiE, partial [bacterium]|nr:bifunctional demethylmenaquinone methyltransferase/2-methoxy-6-polyprenyl-1,4-benzoquinol methylase UbiE [Candidatus Kapabacteria bacterium]